MSYGFWPQSVEFDGIFVYPPLDSDAKSCSGSNTGSKIKALSPSCHQGVVLNLLTSRLLELEGALHAWSSRSRLKGRDGDMAVAVSVCTLEVGGVAGKQAAGGESRGGRCGLCRPYHWP